MDPDPDRSEGARDRDPEGALLGKDEMNLAEFPITLLTDRAPDGPTRIERQVQVYDAAAGHVVTRKVTITASDQYGVPTAKDNEVLLGLIYLTKRANNFRARSVPFRRAELIQVLGWPENGRSYKRVLLSLCRWANVFLLYENSWWDKPKQGYATRGLGIIDDFELRDGAGGPLAPGRTDPPRSRFSWNEIFFNSLKSGFVRTLDLGLLLRLKHPTSQQMYRFLGKQFHSQRILKIDLRQFACERIGISRASADSGKLKEKLRPALEELEAVGFLEPMRPEERYTKVGRGAWTITLRRQWPAPAGPGEERPEAGPGALERELTARGVTAATAAALVRDYPAERIRAQLEHLDWLSGAHPKKVGDPAAYLVAAIRRDYAAPTGFESRADRVKREAAERERQQQEAEARRRQGAEQARARAIQAEVTAYWNGLSPAGQARLEADALARAEEELARSYREMKARNNPVAAMILCRIREVHIQELLNLGGPDPPVR